MEQAIFTFQGFVKEDLIQNLFVDVLDMDHVGMICEDELLIFLKLLGSEREKEEEEKAGHQRSTTQSFIEIPSHTIRMAETQCW